MSKYQTKPVEIEAVQWLNKKIYEPWFCEAEAAGVIRLHGDELSITTLEGVMRANRGDYIIKGLVGEFYPCKPEVFEMKYEPVDESETGKLKRHFQAWARSVRESVRVNPPVPEPTNVKC
jgi:hypothetical protein